MPGVSRLVPSLLLATAGGLVPAAAGAAPSFGPPQRIAALAGGDAASAGIAVGQDAQGRAVAGWIDAPLTTTSSAKVVSRTATGGWSTPTTFGGSEPLTGLELTVHPSGWAGVAWANGGFFAPSWAGAVRSPGGVWSSPIERERRSDNPEAGTTRREVGVAVGPAGELFAGWTRIVDLNPGTFTTAPEWRLQFRGAGATSFTEQPVVTPATPLVPTLDAAGNALLIATRPGGRVTAEFRPAGGDWGAPAVISEEQQGVDFPAKPSVAFAPDGSATAAWIIGVGGAWQVQAARRSAAGEWSPVRTIGVIGLQRDVGPGELLIGAAADRTVIAWVGGSKLRFGPSSSTLQAYTFTPTAEGTDNVAQLPVEFGITSPRLSVADGHALLTWSTAEGRRGATLEGGLDWSEPFPLPGAADATNVGATIDAAGRADTLWTQDGAIFSSRSGLQASRVVKVDVGLTGLFGARCPATAQVAINLRVVASLPTQGAGATRCRVTGTVPVSSSLAIGAPVTALVTAGGLLPSLTITRVTAG